MPKPEYLASSFETESEPRLNRIRRAARFLLKTVLGRGGNVSFSGTPAAESGTMEVSLTESKES